MLIVGIITSLNSYEAKADVGVQSSQGINVRSTKVEINRVIKVPSTEVDREKLSRGSSSVANNLIEYSYRFLGKPYVWAATGPSAFDCSGYTAYVYKKFGYYLPHYTGDQVEMGKAVSRDSLRTGDLVFFDTTGSDSHVGIYIGSGNFIHASSGRKRVMVSSLDEAYYESRYSEARRIIN
jgi:cell wall-associated NlpC family hydrolase